VLRADIPVFCRSDQRLMPPDPAPRIEITADLLRLIERHPAGDARLERTPEGRITGGMLRLSWNGVRTVYRITGAVPGIDAYMAEWPD
jgi:hypothetical protein